MLTLSKRSCRIGSSINTRVEFQGDEEVTALDIPLTEIKLEAEELNALLQEPHAHNVLYSTKAGAPAEPVLKNIKALRLASKIEGAEIALSLGGDTTLKLINCKLSRIELALELGGYTSMSAQVQCVPKLDSTIARLMEKLHSEISVAIRVEGFGEQQKLPLEAKADAGEAYETGKAEGARRISATGRKVAAAAVKAKRKSRAKNGHASAA